MSSFEELLIEQRATVEQLRRVVPNYRKLGKDKFSISKTRVRIQTLQEMWSRCRNLDIRLRQTADATNLKHTYFLNSEFVQAESDYEDFLDKLTEFLDQQENAERSTASSKPANISLIGETQGTSAFALPRITIPKFNGESTKWESFRDSFKALVGENNCLTAGQKLYYLKSFLEGNAARMIEHVTVSDANYEGAWNLLEDEYDNPRALIMAHIHAFASLRVMTTEQESELKLLRDTVNHSLAALKNLKRPVDEWDDLLVYLISQKFSPRTRTEWNLSLGASNEFPSYQTLKDFLTERIRGIAVPVQFDKPSNLHASSQSKTKATVHSTAAKQCPDCSGSHGLVFCPAWSKKTLDERFALAKSKRLCFNCLKSGHFPNNCPNSNRCKECKKSHHTTLHRVSLGSTSATIVPDAQAETSVNNTASVNLLPSQASQINTPRGVTPAYPSKLQDHATICASPQYLTSVLLATAWVRLRTPEDRVIKARALIDQGSSHSFITESLAQILRTPRRRADLDITVFGDGRSARATSYVNLSLESCYGPKATAMKMSAYIFPNITNYSAYASRKVSGWSHLQGLQLADPDPSSKEPINVLIGADLYGQLLLGPLRKGPLGSPTAQLTTLGWIISGPIDRSRDQRTSSASMMHCAIAPSTDALLQQFWEIEEIPTQKFLTPEEEECENHFRSTHSRDSTGRYVVRLPFRHGSLPKIGDSHKIALSRYAQQEQRLIKKPELAQAYSAFLQEYESMGHMEKVTSPDTINKTAYVPHHPVIRESSATTRVRVVFNASSATSNGTSLNEHLHIGPKLQRDIGAVLSSWRRHQYVYIADIEKMFRQIKVHRDDVDYQRIVWRPTPNGPIENYRLLTVTYGTACAPYLANRVLAQLADDERNLYPDAVTVIQHSTYVDDVLFGADEQEEARALRSQVVALLQRGGFTLRKWAANDITLLSDIPALGHDLVIDLSKEDSAIVKVLGITWLPKEDSFSFQVEEIPKTRITKRSILSVTAKLFDPLGWASPVVIRAKLLMQDLWLAKVDWDDSVPQQIQENWEHYCRELPSLSNLRIPRWIGLLQSHGAMELHGFADASQRAYSAVVYLRILNSPKDILVSLIAAKSKVAPLKTVAIPRLELNGIVLLVRLLEYVKEVFKFDSIPVYGWTDSTVALAWLTQHPSRWKPYVANRVSEIQTKMPDIKWHHVPTRENPADCASRGITTQELIDHTLWRSGPSWLKQNSAFWPNSRPCASSERIVDQTLVFNEQRAIALMHVAQEREEWDFSVKFSTWGKLLRVTGLLFHWLCKFRAKKSTSLDVNFTDSVQAAREFWIRKIQRDSFAAEIRALQTNAPLPRSTALRSLNPFLDQKGQLRLGGRLRHSFLSYNERFPLVLPRHRVSELIIDQTHLQSLHGGPQLTLRLLRQNYWILGARSVVKSRINQCLRCARERAVSARQLMGDLPSPRVNPSAPFTHCGVDYAGPFHILPYVGRGQKTRKYYVALFVCLATRAIHLEYVDDYATSGFLAAFQRFVSRRGLPSDVYSDNGTNFQGADNELRRAFISTVKNSDLRAKFATDGIRWHFIPASAPHFGGLWEAGVKSFKSHMKRVVGSHTLSQLEFSTLLCEIEACLNSRPIAPLHDDPDNFDALTPGHFLIGRPLLSVPEPSLLDANEKRLSRWQRVIAMREHVWKAWTHDYLHTLQQRAKWQTPSRSLTVGTLVLLKNELLPPCRWELARVIETHPGPDGHVRVVTLRTAKTKLKRPIAKVCPLPCVTGST